MSLFCWTQRKIFWRMWETEQFWGTIDFHNIYFPSMEVNGAPKQLGYKLSSKYLHLCSAEQRYSYRFGNTWGWVNDDRIFIFWWTFPLMQFLASPALHLSLIQILSSAPTMNCSIYTLIFTYCSYEKHYTWMCVWLLCCIKTLIRIKP